MSDPLHCDDGCTMSPQEALAAMRIAHSDEPRATAEEFAQTLSDFPDKGRESELNRMLHGDGLPEEFPPLAPSIIDRGLLLMAIQPSTSNLGCANGWRDTPLLVEKCKHPRDSKKIGRCLTEYSCAICNFKFTVDSGD